MITATALSVAVWTLFVVWTVKVITTPYDLMTIITGTPLVIVFGCSTTWEVYREWRKMRDEDKRIRGSRKNAD